MNKLEIKRNIWDLHFNAGCLFNDYYYGDHPKYTREDIAAILARLDIISEDINNIKELLKDDSNL